MATFEKYPGARFAESDVISYLETLCANGWQVYSGKKPSQYIIQLDENSTVNLEPANPHEKGWKINCYSHGSVQAIKWATNFSALETLVSEQASRLGFNINAAPVKLRTSADKPMSNLKGVVSLTSGHTVLCIHDPYFDDLAMGNLNTMINLGLKLDPVVRVLRNSKRKKGLTENAIQAFQDETGTQLDVRLIADGHRRFVLLTGGLSLILGWSLNNWKKDEAAQIESEKKDFDFFNDCWSSATEVTFDA